MSVALALWLAVLAAGVAQRVYVTCGATRMAWPGHALACALLLVGSLFLAVSKGLL